MRSLKLIISLCFVWLTVASQAQSFDQYGGDTRTKRKATGYFRVEQIKQRWFFIAPDGHPFIALGANHVGLYWQNQAAEMGLFARHNNDRAAASEALYQSIRELGLNAGDAYQSVAAYQRRLPFIQPFEYLETKGEHLDVFDAAMRQRIIAHVTARARAIADNPWGIGLVGPDLPVWDSRRVNRFREAEPESAGRQRYAAFLRERHGDIAKVNAIYATKFASFAELAAAPKLTFETKATEAKAADEAFAALLAKQLFRIARAAVKAGAPHHLYLGERTQLRSVPDAVLKVMGKYVDVFCTQAIIRVPRAVPEWQVFQRDGYDHEFALVNKPMMIVDWAAPFSLGEPFDSAQGRIKAEAEATADAVQFLHDAFARPYLTGIFICQLIGTHPNDKNFFDLKAHRTYLRPDGTRYAVRSQRLRETNAAILQKLYAAAR
jgi:hypothetical protein